MKTRVPLIITILSFNILLCCPFYGSSLNQTEDNIFGVIEELFTKRIIDLDQASLYKIYALVKPEKLPVELQSFTFENLDCGTTVIDDVLRNSSLLSKETLNEIYSLLLPEPDDDDVFLDSSKYPIRIHFPAYFNEYSWEFTHEEFLNYAEYAWEQEVEVMGFTPPPPDNGFGGNDYYDFYLRDITHAGGYMVCLSRYMGVEWYSFASCCVVSLNTYTPHITIAHEFQHSCQYSTDAAERGSIIMEGTASYIGFMVADGSITECDYILKHFQELPHKSIDFVDYDLYYDYGTIIFFAFLCEFYDNGNPEFIRKIWDGCKQKGTVNEPDFMDSIASLVYEYKGHTFEDTYREFAIWRYFTHKNDDGKHLKDADKWNKNSRVKVEKKITIWDLPLTDFCSANPPSEFGANYMELFLENTEGSLVLDFKGDESKLWSSDMILIPAIGLSNEYAEAVKMGDTNGFLFVPDVGTYEKLVLVISNLSDGDHDPDNYDWASSDYSLNLKIALEPESRVITGKQLYKIGDELTADVVTINPTDDASDVDLIVALKIGDSLLYYPGWTSDLSKKRITIESKSSNVENVLTIESGEWLKGGLTFYSALVEPKTGELIGEINETQIDFFDPENPTAKFTISPETGDLETMFIFDAALSFDAKDKIKDLQVRWDWEDDGNWDTPYLTKKTRGHRYKSTGEKTIRLEVLDTDGNTDQTKKTVNVTS